MGIKDNSKES